MKTVHLLPALLIALMLIPACEKNEQDSNPDSEKFAVPVWIWDSGQSMQFSSVPVPAIDLQNNSFFVIKSDTGLILLSLDQNGAKRWSVEKDFSGSNNSSGSVILSESNLYFYSGHTLYCYNKENGEEVWHFGVDFPASAIHNFLVRNSEVWFIYGESGEIILQKLNSSGVNQWSVSYPYYSTNLGMASFEDKLILLNKDLYAYHVDVLSVSMLDGSIYWTVDPDIEAAGADPVIDGEGNVYFSTFEGELVALNASDGSVRWTFEDTLNYKGERFVNSSSITILSNNDIVYPSCDLYCFDNDGNQKWRSSLDSYMSTTLGNNNILYGWGGCDETSLYAIDASNGEILSAKFSTLDTDMLSGVPPLAIDHQGYIIAVGFQNIHCITSLSTSLEENGWSKIGKGYENNCVR